MVTQINLLSLQDRLANSCIYTMQEAVNCRGRWEQAPGDGIIFIWWHCLSQGTKPRWSDSMGEEWVETLQQAKDKDVSWLSNVE